MISPFWGELGLTETPLEVSHNYCSHKCAYCFANLNKPGRTADVKKIFNQLTKAHVSDTYTSALINHRYPIAVSNKSDPFALSNYKISVPMLKQMSDMGIPIEMQSRGGLNGVDEFLSYHKEKMVWFLSITHTSDDTRKLVEPGATSIDYRWDLMAKLQSMGHKVIVAINPYSSKWIDNDKMLLRLEANRPDAVIIQNLHLNFQQMANMTEREVNNGGEAFAIAKKRLSEDEREKTKQLYDGITSLNIPCLYYAYPTKTNGMSAMYREVYGKKIFNTHWSFIDWCFENKQEGEQVYFQEYLKHMTENVPFAFEKFNITSYATSICRKFRTGAAERSSGAKFVSSKSGKSYKVVYR